MASAAARAAIPASSAARSGASASTARAAPTSAASSGATSSWSRRASAQAASRPAASETPATAADRLAHRPRPRAEGAREERGEGRGHAGARSGGAAADEGAVEPRQRAAEARSRVGGELLSRAAAAPLDPVREPVGRAAVRGREVAARPAEPDRERGGLPQRGRRTPEGLELPGEGGGHRPAERGRERAERRGEPRERLGERAPAVAVLRIGEPREGVVGVGEPRQREDAGPELGWSVEDLGVEPHVHSPGEVPGSWSMRRGRANPRRAGARDAGAAGGRGPG